MSPRSARLVLFLVLLSLPVVASPPRENRYAARIRSSSAVRPVAVEPEGPSVETAPVAAAASVGGVDLAGLLGMLTALAASYVYARGQRLSVARQASRPTSVSVPADPR